MKTANETEEVSINSIRSDELCLLTGLTDRRLRQLAQQGFYPPPNRGVYQREETLRGLFRYYKESQERETAALRQEEIGYTRARRRKTELELEQAIGAVVPMECVDFVFANVWLPFRQRLYIIPRDAAYDCEGKNRGEIQHILEREIDKAITEHRKSFDVEKLCDQMLEEAGVKKPKGENEDETENDPAE
jgi:phage terminase Nu1 subunit (DNA packaging protein)